MFEMNVEWSQVPLELAAVLPAFFYQEMLLVTKQSSYPAVHGISNSQHIAGGNATLPFCQLVLGLKLLRSGVLVSVVAALAMALPAAAARVRVFVRTCVQSQTMFSKATEEAAAIPCALISA